MKDNGDNRSNFTKKIQEDIDKELESLGVGRDDLAFFIATDCTCNEKCPIDCRGKCGCKSCRDEYQDFLSAER